MLMLSLEYCSIHHNAAHGVILCNKRILQCTSTSHCYCYKKNIVMYIQQIIPQIMMQSYAAAIRMHIEMQTMVYSSSMLLLAKFNKIKDQFSYSEGKNMLQIPRRSPNPGKPFLCISFCTFLIPFCLVFATFLQFATLQRFSWPHTTAQSLLRIYFSFSKHLYSVWFAIHS